jgi:polysaccharide biosynthesis protein PslH
MNILFVVPYTPNLVRVRPYNLIRSLTARGNRVTVMTLYSDEAERNDAEVLKSECEAVVALPLSRSRSLMNCLKVLPSSIPLQAVYCWQPELSAAIRKKLEGGGFDVVHVEHLRGACYGFNLGAQKSIPVVWDSVDSISHLFRQTSRQAKKISSRMMAGFELGRTEKYESWAANHFARVLVTSPVDQQAFLSLKRPPAPDRVCVLRNGVDLDYFTPGEFAKREAATLVVSGKMSYHANVTMTLHLAQDILPLVWKERPDVKLWVVGKDPPRELLALAQNPAVLVTGSVKDIRPFLQQATLAAAPITYGAGIQNKVLEAMACATPVVATPQAVSALSIRDGDEILLAEESDQFARKILDLLSDASMQERVGQAGRLAVETKYSWGAIAAQLEQVYQDVLKIREDEKTGKILVE